MAIQATAIGHIWDIDDEPMCSYCDELATRVTPTRGIYLCDDTDCALNYVNEECDTIEYEDVDECMVCGAIDGIVGVVLSVCSMCGGVVCQGCAIETPHGVNCPDCAE